MADFMDNLDRVNAIADRSPGFVWRLQDEGGNATRIAFSDDAQMIVNMSVWESPEALEDFTWNTLHKQFYARRAEWFQLMKSHHMVMWWVSAGHTPTLAEAAERLEYLDTHGSTDRAFGWESLPDQQAWRQARCA
jgi:heme-degrading monooxygenase HmoA